MSLSLSLFLLLRFGRIGLNVVPLHTTRAGTRQASAKSDTGRKEKTWKPRRLIIGGPSFFFFLINCRDSVQNFDPGGVASRYYFFFSGRRTEICFYFFRVNKSIAINFLIFVGGDANEQKEPPLGNNEQ